MYLQSNPLGNTTRLAFEGGDLLSVTDPLGQTESYLYDGLGSDHRKPVQAD